VYATTSSGGQPRIGTLAVARTLEYEVRANRKVIVENFIGGFAMASRCALTAILGISLTACATAGRYDPAPSLAKLEVGFADPAWNGRAIPAGQQCSQFGGKGASPALVVKGIPPGTTDLLVEFNDSDYPPLSTGGGHGTIRVPLTPGATEARIPSVPGETNALPAGVVKEESHRGPMSPGTAYLPPCSGGRGNLYFADGQGGGETGGAGGAGQTPRRGPDHPGPVLTEDRNAAGREAAQLAWQARSAWSRSSRRSSTPSMPTDIRNVPGPMPSAACRSASSHRCVVRAGFTMME